MNLALCSDSIVADSTTKLNKFYHTTCTRPRCIAAAGELTEGGKYLSSTKDDGWKPHRSWLAGITQPLPGRPHTLGTASIESNCFTDRKRGRIYRCQWRQHFELSISHKQSFEYGLWLAAHHLLPDTKKPCWLQPSALMAAAWSAGVETRRCASGTSTHNPRCRLARHAQAL